MQHLSTLAELQASRRTLEADAQASSDEASRLRSELAELHTAHQGLSQQEKTLVSELRVSREASATTKGEVAALEKRIAGQVRPLFSVWGELGFTETLTIVRTTRLGTSNTSAQPSSKLSRSRTGASRSSTSVRRSSPTLALSSRSSDHTSRGWSHSSPRRTRSSLRRPRSASASRRT